MFHDSVCEGYLAVCKNCNQNDISRKNINNHEKNECHDRNENIIDCNREGERKEEEKKDWDIIQIFSYEKVERAQKKFVEPLRTDAK